jgi:DDE superfamily endonuclease
VGKKNSGKRLVYAQGNEDLPVQRAKVEVDYEQHGTGDVLGAFCPASGEVWTCCYERRTKANWLAFLPQVETGEPTKGKQGYAIMDTLGMQKGTDALLFALAHPRWEGGFQPTRAAYLNLIEPWWKHLRSLAFAGQSCESWGELCEAVKQATGYWNAHRYPLVWGRRRRHHPRRRAGIALLTAHP